MRKKRYTAAFGAQVVQEALREAQTLAQPGAIHGVYPTVIADRKAQALEGLPSWLSVCASLSASWTTSALNTAVYCFLCIILRRASDRLPNCPQSWVHYIHNRL